MSHTTDGVRSDERAGKASEAALLTEYEVCQKDAAQVDNDVWRSGSLFMTLSLCGITYVLSRHGQDQEDHYVNLAICSMGLVVQMIWSLMAVRWFGLVGVAFYRMGEIERLLGLRYKTYIDMEAGRDGADTSACGQRLMMMRLPRTTGRRISIRAMLLIYIALLGSGWLGLGTREAPCIWRQTSR